MNDIELMDEKEKLFLETAGKLKKQGFEIREQDQCRPWGGFFVINDKHAEAFADFYFNEMRMEELSISGKISPKILLVAPQKRLSWQYHHRRAEIWKVLEGRVGVVRSKTDEEGPMEIFGPGALIKLQQGERHRLVGLEEWGMLAEIWQHTDEKHLSDEQDIVRVQDDFGR